MVSTAAYIVHIFSLIRKTFLYTSPLILLGGLWLLRARYRKFPLEAIIFEKRGENLVKTNDRVGKKVDKYTNMTFYQLQKSRDTIPVYNFDWILHNVVVSTTIFEKILNLIRLNTGTIFLFRYGSKQYKPININQDPAKKMKLVQSKNKEGEPIFTWAYMGIDPRSPVGALDFDVVDWDNINFMVQEQRASILRRTKRGEWLKTVMLPLAFLAASIVVCIFILKFSADTGADLRGGGGAEPATGGSGSKVGGVIQDAITPGT